MKKALLAALTFIVVGFMLVNGTFANDFSAAVNSVFKNLTKQLDKFGLPEPGGATIDVALVSDSTAQQLFPGGEASRTTSVRNQGTGPVYFRLVYAVQYDKDSWDKLTINFDGVDFVESKWYDITVGTISYKMAVLTYTEALPTGEQSPDVTMTIAMQADVTSEEISRYREDFLLTQVLAIETAAFADRTATAALDLALPLDENFNPF